MNKGKIYGNIKDEWYTPKEVVDYFGGFDLDPATTKENLKRLNISKGYTKEDDGLLHSWLGKVWLNPPFSMKDVFIEKALEEHRNNKNDIYILLPMSFETKYFHKLFDYGVDVYIPKGRIVFLSNQSKSSSPAFGSCVVRLSGDKNKMIIIKDWKNGIKRKNI